MRYKFLPSTFLLFLQMTLGLRIPPNPCPEVFQYYKDANGQIYGEAVVPYDNATFMEFTVNASLVGIFKKAELKLKMVTAIHELNDFTPTVVYDIFFPFNNIIPKITGVTYNGNSFCRGPQEPVVPGGPGITNVWNKYSFQFSRRTIGSYKPDPNPDRSDTDLPTKNPGERPQGWQRPQEIPKPVISSRPQKPLLGPQVYEETPANELPPEKPLPPERPVTPAKPVDNGPERFPLDPYPIDIDSIFTTPTTTTPAPATFTSPSVTANSEFKCGVSSNQPPKNYIVPLIYNGVTTDIGEYPWLVAFMSKKIRTPEYEYKCSGNLVSDKHVITAARCIQYFGAQIVETEDILLVMGTNSLSNWQSSGAVSRTVKKVNIHPYFKENSKSAHGDLAVLTMERPVQFSKVLAPVCLWKGNTDLYPFTNKMGVLAGYGQDEDAYRQGLLHAVRLKRANMPIVPQGECWTSPVGFNDLTSDRTFCTKSGEIPTGPCIGDSGAGFFIKLNGAYYLRGIASAISSNNGTCDLSKQYSVFCDVAKFLDWIKTAME